MGRVRTAPGGFPSFERRLRGREYQQDGEDNAFVNLRETTRTEVTAWCPRCGGRPVKVAALLASVDGYGPSVILL